MKFLHLYVYEFLYERRGLNIELIAAVSQKDAEVIFKVESQKGYKKNKDYINQKSLSCLSTESSTQVKRGTSTNHFIQ